MERFNVGDLVWAKMPHYPYWPAIISLPEANLCAPYKKEPQHFVIFYGAGSNNCSWIPDRHIKHHSPELLKNARSKPQLQNAVDVFEKVLAKIGVISDKQSEDEETNKKTKPKRKYRKKVKKIEEKNELVSKKHPIGENHASKVTDFDAFLAENKALEKLPDNRIVNKCVSKNKNLEKTKKRASDLDVRESNKKIKVAEESNTEIKKMYKVKETSNVNENQIELKKDSQGYKKVRRPGRPKKVQNKSLTMQTKKDSKIKKLGHSIKGIHDKNIQAKVTSNQKSFEQILFSKEILTNDFWKNRRSKIQALLQVQKVIEVLKKEVVKEGLEKIGDRQTLNDNKAALLKAANTILKAGEFCSEFESFHDELLLKIISNYEGRMTDFTEKLFEDVFEEKLNEKDNLKDKIAKIIASFPCNMEIPADISELEDMSELEDISEPEDISESNKDCDLTQQCSFEKISEPLFGWNLVDGKPEYTPSPKKFGFLGNGFLGSFMIKNLLLSKHNVTLYDFSTSQTDEENDPYLNHVNSVAEMMENCDIIFSYCKDSSKAKSQMFQAFTSVPQSIIAKKGYVELSTLDPETALLIGQHFTEKGGRFLEVALLGDIWDLETNQLVVLASGDQRLFDECRTPFLAFAKHMYYYPGKLGRGSIMKIGHSMMQGTALAGLSEVVALIQSQGFTEDLFTEILNLTPFQDEFWLKKAKEMFKKKYFPSKLVHDQSRDLTFGLDIALNSNVPVWICSAAISVYKKVIKSEQDVASIHDTPLKTVSTILKPGEFHSEFMSSHDEFFLKVISNYEEKIKNVTEEFIEEKLDENEYMKDKISKIIATLPCNLEIPQAPEDISESNKDFDLTQQCSSEKISEPLFGWNLMNGKPEFTPSPKKFGFFGNGFLGSSLLKNLLLSKHNVTLYDFSTSQTNEEKDPYFNHLLKLAKKANSVKEMMENCDIIFSYCKDSSKAKSQMFLALSSVPQSVFAKKGYVELSTLDPETALLIGQCIKQKRGRFLEVALLGNMWDSDTSQLVVLASGDQTLFDECKTPFLAIAKHMYYYPGKPGLGSIMKIGHSMMQGIALTGLSEVVALMQSQGFTEDQFTDILNLTPFQDEFWLKKAKEMFKKKYFPSKPVHDQRRDLALGLDIAVKSNVPVWMCSAANCVFKKVIKSERDVAFIHDIRESLKQKSSLYRKMQNIQESE